MTEIRKVSYGRFCFCVFVWRPLQDSKITCSANTIYITNLLVVVYIYIETKMRYCHILKLGSFRPILNVTRPEDFFPTLGPTSENFQYYQRSPAFRHFVSSCGLNSGLRCRWQI